MEQTLKRRIAGGAAGLALLAGAGGAAFAESSGGSDSGRQHGGPRLHGPGDRGHGFYGGPPPPGTPPPLPGPPPGRTGLGPPPRPPGPPPLIIAGLGAAAKYLGLTGEQLRTQLHSGKSLAEIAKARSKSVEGLKSAIETAVTREFHARLDDLVNGKLRRHRRHP